MKYKSTKQKVTGQIDRKREREKERDRVRDNEETFKTRKIFFKIFHFMASTFELL